MVKPSSRAGQRRRAISWRTMRGRLGSSSTESAARAATPAAAARRINFRLVVGRLIVERRDNRFRALTLRVKRHAVSIFQHNAKPPTRDMTRNAPAQKANVACSSMRRLAELPCENGPPCRELETPKNLEPSTALGLATFTLLKTLRTPKPSVKLYRRSELDDMLKPPPPPNSGPPRRPPPPPPGPRDPSWP